MGAVCTGTVSLLWQGLEPEGGAGFGSSSILLTACTILNLSHITIGIVVALSMFSGVASFLQEYTPMIGLFILRASVMV